MKEKKFTTRNLVLVVLVLGIVLVGFGMFGKLGNALTQQTTFGDPGEELALDNLIAYREAVAVCEGQCNVDFTNDPVPIGRLIGGYLISFRFCDVYQGPEGGGDGVYECTESRPAGGGPGYGTFSSGFGILMIEYGEKEPGILIPLSAKDVPDVGFLEDQLVIWTKWKLDENTAGGFGYTYQGTLGECSGPEDTCGRVYLEEIIKLRPK